MNAEMPDRAALREDSSLRAVLIANCRLSTEEVAQITEASQDLNLSFARAAVQLGIVTEEELGDAQEWSRRFSSPERMGPVETAMRRVTTISRKAAIQASDQPRSASSRLIFEREPYNSRSEKIRALRTELLMLSQSDSSPCTLAIVSPFGGEGRSQLAAELALAFGQLGRNTLLVDADLRRPKQQQLFEGPVDEHGLAHALASHSEPLVHPVLGQPNLYVLPTGTLPPNPLELLSGRHFKNLLTDWRRSFDFVVLDTPPIADFADGLAVATIAERALVLSRAEHTTYRGFRDMLRRLATAEARIMGAVISRF